MKRLALLVLSAASCMAQQKLAVTVSVDVSFGKDETMEAVVDSLLRRTLARLDGVSLVTDSHLAEYRFRIVGLHDRTHTGASLGYSMAILIEQSHEDGAERLRKYLFSQLQLPKDREKSLDLFKIYMDAVLMRGAVRVVSFEARSGAESDLVDACQAIVSDFDTGTLQPRREAVRASQQTK